MRYGQTSSQSSPYVYEEQLSHGYQTRNYQSTNTYTSINSNSDVIQSPNQVPQDQVPQVSEDSEELEYNFADL